MSKLLIIDDDTELCEMLSEYLAIENFVISSVHNGTKGAEAVLAESYDAVVLDVMLPGMNGFDVLKKIREHSRVPVIMLTAKGDDIDRILGLEMGADDYLPKPFNPRELAARIKAILRRATASEETGNTECGQLSVKPSARKAFFADKELLLTSTEFMILLVLVENAGQVVSKEALCEQALGREIAAYDRSVDMHISHLRKKIPDGENLIITVRGTGYQLVKEG